MKLCLKLLIATPVLFSISADIVSAKTAMFAQSSFGSWGGTGWGYGAATSSSTGPVSNGGNPGSYVLVQLSLSAPSATIPAWAIDWNNPDDWNYNPVVDGKITSVTLSVDSLLRGGPANASQIGVELAQGGYTYIALGTLPVGTGGWTHQSTMTLNSNDFVFFDSGSSTGYDATYHPDFTDTGRDMRFGVYQWLYVPAGGPAVSTDYAMDNIVITVNAVPEPSAFALVIAGCAGGISGRRRSTARDRG